MLNGTDGCLPLILFGLPALVMPKVIEDAGGVTIGVQDAQHRHALRMRHLLSVARVCHRLVFIVLELNVPELHVRNILHVYPTDAKLALPFVLGPDTTVALIVNGRDHLRHAAKVAGPVDGEEEIERSAFATCLAVSLI